MRIAYSEEGPEPLETGGGIFRALPLLQDRADEPFLVLNGDVWMDYPYARLRERFASGLPGDDLAHVVLVPNPAHNPTWRFLLQDGRMLEPVPGPERRIWQSDLAVAAGASRFTFSGLGVYHAVLFAGCTDGTFKLAPLLRAAARAGRVSAELYDGRLARYRHARTPGRAGRAPAAAQRERHA